MNIAAIKRLYQDTIKKWGEKPQVEMAIEEMAELILALRHYDRGRISGQEVISEIADVQIMMAQLAVMYGEHRVEEAKAKKLARLAERVYSGAEASMSSRIPPYTSQREYKSSLSFTDNVL